MALTVSEHTGGGEGKDYDPVPAGVHEGVCYLLCEIGTHYDAKWDKHKREIIVGWEIPSERIDYEKDGETKDAPRCISRKYTLSLGEKANLRKDLESWRGRPFTQEELDGFDLFNILGKTALIQVMHRKSNDGKKTWANVTNLMSCKKGLEIEGEIQKFSLEENGMEIPDNIPPWIAKQIKDSEEFSGQGQTGTQEQTDMIDVGAPIDEDPEDALPF